MSMTPLVQLRRLVAIAFLLGASLCLPVEAAMASPGDPYPGFGQDGRVIQPVGAMDSEGAALVVTPDGDYVVAGSAYVRMEPDPDPPHYLGAIGLARFNQDGSLDQAFGSSGTVAARPSGISEGQVTVYAMVRQPDGKYVVEADDYFCCTHVSGGGYLARFNQDGSLDTGFGVDGIARLSDEVGHIGQNLAVQPDGKLLVEDAPSFSIIRFNANGTRDQSFGNGGKTTITIPDAAASSVAVLPGGRIAVGGGSGSSGEPPKLTVVRLMPSGVLDTSFADSGVFKGQSGIATDMAIAPNGAIVAGGTVSGTTWIVTRLRANGTPDPAFGGRDGGASMTVAGGYISGDSLALQANDKVVVAGYFNDAGPSDQRRMGVALGRFNADGSRDTGFGEDGSVIEARVDRNLRPEMISDLAVDSDGSIIGAGRFETFGSNEYGPYELGHFGVGKYVGDPPPPDSDGDGVPDGDDECPDQSFDSDNGCPPLPAKSYVALGDSVAAGEGINYGWKWEPGGEGSGRWTGGEPAPPWNNPYQDCHRSLGGYPWQVKADLNLSLTHLACTGSTAQNGVLNPRTDPERVFPPESQLGGVGSTPPSSTYDAAKPDIVTLTIGANDLGFADTVEDCYKRDCQPNPPYDFQKEGLRVTLQEILERGTASGKVPLVVMTTYYNPFPRRYPAQPKDCRDLAILRDLPDLLGGNHLAYLSNEEVGQLVSGLNRLNANIREVAASFPNVVVVDPPSFKDNAWCSSDPWAYGPSIKFTAAGQDSAAPFHPTPEGQQQIASSVVSTLSNGRVAPPGDNIQVPLPSGATVTFDKLTSSGPVIMASGPDALNLPSSDNHVRQIAFDIATSAQYQGSITISVPSSQPATLYHFTNGAWQPVADSLFDGQKVTGTVTSLSPFTLGTPAPQITASFTVSGAGMAPAAVAFDASASSVEGGGAVADYDWDFGDGATGSGVAPSHTFTRSGTYEVKLTVTSQQGTVADVTDLVTITNAPPAASLSAPAHAEPGSSISLSGAGSTDPNGAVTEWIWNFGDGSALETGQGVVHSYATPGSYTVTLRALDDEGAADTATTTVEVSDTVAPETSITGPFNATRDSTPTFILSSEPNATFECRIDSVQVGTFQACTSPFTASPLSDGSHTLDVRSVDGSGNKDGTPASRTFTVDTKPPNTTITAGPSGTTRDRTPTFRFRSGQAGSTFKCKLDLRVSTKCSSPRTYRTLAFGAHKLRVRAIDEAGNRDVTPAVHNFKVVR